MLAPLGFNVLMWSGLDKTETFSNYKPEQFKKEFGFDKKDLPNLTTELYKENFKDIKYDNDKDIRKDKSHRGNIKTKSN